MPHFELVVLAMVVVSFVGVMCRSAVRSRVVLAAVVLAAMGVASPAFAQSEPPKTAEQQQAHDLAKQMAEQIVKDTASHAAPEHKPGGEANLILPDVSKVSFLGGART